MARGTGRKALLANGTPKSREYVRYTRSQRRIDAQPQESVSNDFENVEELKTHSIRKESHICRQTESFDRHEKVLPRHELRKSNNEHCDVHLQTCNGPLSVINRTSTCIVSRTTSHVVDSRGSKVLLLPESNKTCEEYKKEIISLPGREHPSTKIENVVNKVNSNEQHSSCYWFEILIHLNTILYWIVSLSVNQRIKDITQDTRPPELPINPFLLKIISLLAMGILADVSSPKLALLIPQGTCLLIGVFSNLEIFSKSVVYISNYQFLINSSLLEMSSNK
ncbi:hypothetical protein SK128_016795 [Halocaridina rubra]|uniref:Uncharacterized protein n=1 Tax=Halocaridina rubra TaxID=373956 RepID=A0AAN8WUV4_HALRR